MESFCVCFIDSGYVHRGRGTVSGDQGEVEVVDFDVYRLFHWFFDRRLVSFASKYNVHNGSTFRHRYHVTDSRADGFFFLLPHELYRRTFKPFIYLTSTSLVAWSSRQRC